MSEGAVQDGVPTPEGISSLLDTDLYKLTMQCAILKFFPQVSVAYAFTNRTPHMRLTRAAYAWLQTQIERLGAIVVTDDELAWLRKTCPYLSQEYLAFLQTFRLRPAEQVQLSFTPADASSNSSDDSVPGDIHLSVRGRWLDTILYEIPLLALVSEAYFRFVDRDWNHDGQTSKARAKARTLMQAGCVFSEFGSRRRRDAHTHALVLQGIVEAQREAGESGWPGRCAGTSNVHLAMRFGVAPVGTVAHEWFMGIAAVEDDYASANERALRYWTRTFGRGVLAVALTDTFGTPDFLRAFVRPVRDGADGDDPDDGPAQTFAEIFTGVRQDSGDPMTFLARMRAFYAEQGIADRKTIVYSDSLDVDKCLAYKRATDAAGLTPSFGIGTFFTNDFSRPGRADQHSPPLNIVIKLSEAEGRAAVKLSDDKGKNMGNEELVKRVKDVVGYTDRKWEGADEAHRWDR